VAVQGEFRRETGGLVGVEEEVEAQNKVGQTLLNSSNPSAREDIVAVAKAGSTTATAKRRTSLASQKAVKVARRRVAAFRQIAWKIRWFPPPRQPSPRAL